MKVVFDAGVVFSAAGWRGEAYRCLLAMAQRRVTAYATAETLDELSNLVVDRGDKARHPVTNTLNWYQNRVKRVEPAPLGKQRSRDVKDDPYLACAIAAGAKVIVTRDEDLLVLGKPFGIEIITPRELLVRLARGL
ncbi:MAG TPA: putative toxin-antitoxin system toxin component, PIN family [Candidatus Sulfotelmatobacter sp.]|nr:putative toxin-antitoxin system toxin component, PIN family [Candidatus Sulfotelmatobacter sp.]